MAPTAKALADRGGFDLFIAADAQEWVDLEDIIVHTRGNRGYLRVALRLLASAGWLRQHVERNGRFVSYALTAEGRAAVPWAPPLYRQAVAFLPKTLFLEDALFGRQDDALLPSLHDLVTKARHGWDIAPPADPVATKIAEQVRRHLDGVLVGPLIVILARAGVLARLERGPVAVPELGGSVAMMMCVFDLLATQGWATRTGDIVELTPPGAYVAQIAAAYGVTVSYIPMFTKLNALLFGNPRIARVDESGIETMVDRGMNVSSSCRTSSTARGKRGCTRTGGFRRPFHRPTWQP
jgi:hypothetical protein